MLNKGDSREENHIYETQRKINPNRGESDKKRRCDLEKGTTRTEFETEFTLVHTKEIDYLQQPAIAVYFQNMTAYVE